MPDGLPTLLWCATVSSQVSGRKPFQEWLRYIEILLLFVYTEGENVAQKKSKRLVPPEDKQLRFEKLLSGQPSETQQAIQELRVQQMQLERTVSLLRGTLESTADGILVVNNEGKIESFNQRFIELWGIPESIITSRDDNRALAFVLDQLKKPDEFLSKVRELYSNPDAESFDFLEFKDGRLFERYSRPQKIGEKSVGRVWSFRDITKRQRAEEALKRTADELARSNTDLKQFAYAASHDLREPLRSIAGFVKLLEKRYKGKLDEKADEFIAFIIDGVERMDMLIHDLLEYSRVEAKGKDFGPVSCSVALQEAVNNLRSAIEESSAVITYDELPMVMAESPQICSLFQNLIGNAIKFHGREAPRVHVSAERKENEWVFSVKDNGIGINPEAAERIFVVFQRLHTREEYPGTGIGLAICKRIVERHDGRIWVESEPEKGSTFYFTIPDRELITHTPDRRREVRIKQEIPFDFYHGDQRFTANTVDLSEEGLSVKIFGKSSVVVGNTVDLSIGDFSIKAKVIWVKRSPDKSLVGLQKVD
jgi:PAS domain S-box-containing protein